MIFRAVVALWAMHSCLATLLPIRKCCPLHQKLDQTFMDCMDAPEHANATDHAWWFDSSISSRSARPLPAAIPECAQRKMKVSKTTSADYVLTDDGNLVYYPRAGDTSKNASFGADSFCTDYAVYGYFVFLLCPCDAVVCVHKCCGAREHLRVEMGKRGPTTTCPRRPEGVAAWSPEFYDAGQEPVFAVLPTSVECPHNRTMTVLNARPGENLNFSLLTNGSVLVDGHAEEFPPDWYCADDSVMRGREDAPRLLFCVPDEVDPGLGWAEIFYGTMYVVATLFLTATLALYGALPNLRNEASKLLMLHVLCLLVAYLASAVTQFRERMTVPYCKALAFIIQWSFLATYFWLNVMCIDIAWTFRRIRGSKGKRPFFFYSLYAWGCPTLISIVTAVLEFVEDIPDYLQPGLAVHYCWFEGKTATFIYFYGPITLLLVSNVVLFVITTAKIIHARQDTAIVYENNHSDKLRFLMYAKLFILMGATLITEVVSWALATKVVVIWRITDSINILRSFFIFAMISSKPGVMKSLWKRGNELLPRWFPEHSSSKTESTSTQKSDISLPQLNAGTTETGTTPVVSDKNK